MAGLPSGEGYLQKEMEVDGVKGITKGIDVKELGALKGKG
jgi:hypothetical protein